MANSRISRFSHAGTSYEGAAETVVKDTSLPGVVDMQMRPHGDMGLGSKILSAGLVDVVIVTATIDTGVTYTLPAGAGFLYISAGSANLKFGTNTWSGTIYTGVAHFLISDGKNLIVEATANGTTINWIYEAGGLS